jgi:hypothetical protein
VTQNFIYTVTDNVYIAPLGNYSNSWDVDRYKRRFALKSLAFDYHLTMDRLDLPLWEDNEYMDHLFIVILQIGDTIVNIGEPFLNFTTPTLFNNKNFTLYKAGIWKWDNFFINEILLFNLQGRNLDVLNAIRFHWSIIAEIQEDDKR